MNRKTDCFYGVLKQAAAAVLLLVFLAGVSHAGVAEDLASGKSLQEVVSASLAQGVTVENLVAELLAAGVYGREIIQALFDAGVEKYVVIAAALDSGMDKTDVINWSYQCGATREDVQQGFGMAGESMPPNMVFRQTDKINENAQEYNLNSPSQSK